MHCIGTYDCLAVTPQNIVNKLTLTRDTIGQMCVFTSSRRHVPRNGFGEGRNPSTTCSGKSGEVNVSDHKYKVEHNKRNRLEIPTGGKGKKNKRSINK